MLFCTLSAEFDQCLPADIPSPRVDQDCMFLESTCLRIGCSTLRANHMRNTVAKPAWAAFQVGQPARPVQSFTRLIQNTVIQANWRAWLAGALQLTSAGSRLSSMSLTSSACFGPTWLVVMPDCLLVLLPRPISKKSKLCGCTAVVRVIERCDGMQEGREG